MQFEWDEDKRQRNFAKQRVDFESIYEFDWNTALIGNDRRREYGEGRLIALGIIDGRIHVCIYTLRGSIRRIISLRKANKREEKIYEQEPKTTH